MHKHPIVFASTFVLVTFFSMLFIASLLAMEPLVSLFAGFGLFGSAIGLYISLEGM